MSEDELMAEMSYKPGKQKEEDPAKSDFLLKSKELIRTINNALAQLKIAVDEAVDHKATYWEFQQVVNALETSGITMRRLRYHTENVALHGKEDVSDS